MADLGWLPGEGAPRPLATIDPIEDPANRPDGESEHGIVVRHHPEALLRDTPELWEIVDLWNAGVDRVLTRADYAAMSDFELTCWGALRAAHSREQARWLEEHTPRGDGDEQSGG